jgi:hypothetical protein
MADHDEQAPIHAEELADVRGGITKPEPPATKSTPTFPSSPLRPYERNPNLYLGRHDLSYESVYPKGFMAKAFSFGGR